MSGAWVIQPKLLMLVRLAVSILAIWFLFLLYPPRQVLELLTKVGPFWFALAAFLYGVCIFMGAWKWGVLLPVRFTVLLRAVLASCFYSMLPTGMVGGELSKALIVKAARPDAENVVASIMFDKLTGVMALLLLATIALVFADGRAQALQLYPIAALAIGCSAFLLLAPRAAGTVAALHPTNHLYRRGLGFILGLLHSINRYRRDRPLFGKNLMLGLLSQCVLASVYMVLAFGLGLQVGIAGLVAAIALANLAALVPISIGGFGMREAGLTALLTTSYGVPGEEAFALSLSAMGVFVLAAMAGGLMELRLSTSHGRTGGSPRP